MIYIVFTGASQCGKTLSARMMAAYMTSKNISAVRDSFEGPMKHYLSMLYADRASEMNMDKSLCGLDKSPRQFYQLEAAHMRSTYGPAILGELLSKRTKRFKDLPKYIIIDDGSNQQDIRRLEPCVLIRVNRSNIERVYPFTIPNPKYVLANRGTIDALHTAVRRLTDTILIGGVDAYT